MFEMYKNIYATKVEPGRYRIFTGDEQVQVYININVLQNPMLTARLLRNIAKQLYSFHRMQH